MDGTMQGHRTFGTVETLEELNRLNDAQKAEFSAYAEQAGPAFVEDRQASYLRRWTQALAHVPRGATLLDIGGGWPIERIWNAIREHAVDYHLLDIDAGIIGRAREWCPTYGLPAANANLGGNTSIPYPDARFDFLFSSHCIEHSPDLAETLSEMRRVLKENGKVFMAVPFGYDDSDEHLLYLDAEGWVSAMESAGFEVLTTAVDKTYVVAGWDLCILARRTSGDVDRAALDRIAERNTKTGRSVIPAGDASLHYDPGFIESEPRRILSGVGGSMTIAADSLADVILFLRHDYSGTVRISGGSKASYHELFSRIPYVAGIDVSAMKGELVTVTIVDAGAGGHAQAVIHGILSKPA